MYIILRFQEYLSLYTIGFYRSFWPLLTFPFSTRLGSRRSCDKKALICFLKNSFSKVRKIWVMSAGYFKNQKELRYLASNNRTLNDKNILFDSVADVTEEGLLMVLARVKIVLTDKVEKKLFPFTCSAVVAWVVRKPDFDFLFFLLSVRCQLELTTWPLQSIVERLAAKKWPFVIPHQDGLKGVSLHNSCC